MLSPRKNRWLAAAATIVLLSTASACSSTDETADDDDFHMSRVQLYDSIEALADDSDLVVLGTVASQRVTADIDPVTDFTLSKVHVTSVIQGDLVFEGKTVTVRQIGSEEYGGNSVLLNNKDVYLLYLTLSGLDGDLAEQYYVTGGNAGIYVSPSQDVRAAKSDQGASFKQLAPHEGEPLPTEVQLGKAAGDSN